MQIQGDVLAEINNKYKVGLNVSARLTGRVKSWSVGLRSAINYKTVLIIKFKMLRAGSQPTEHFLSYVCVW